MGPNQPLLLELLQSVHLCPLGLIPVGLVHAVDLHDIDIVGLKLFEESLDQHIGQRALLLGESAGPGPHLRDQLAVLAAFVLQHTADVGMGSVHIGHVELPDSVIVGVVQQGFKLLLPQPRLIGLAAAPSHTCAARDATGLQCFAQRNGCGGVNLGRSGQGDSARHKGPGRPGDGRAEEFTTLDFHGPIS